MREKDVYDYFYRLHSETKPRKMTWQDVPLDRMVGYRGILKPMSQWGRVKMVVRNLFKRK